MYGITLKNSSKNTQYQILLLGQNIPDVDIEYDRVVDIKYQFPYWILDRSEATDPVNHLVNFVQEYYNWLYIKSGYELTKTSFHFSGLSRLMDIDETPIEYLKHLSYSYASGLSVRHIGATAGPGGTDTSKNIRSLLKGIRQNLYQQKSNEEAYRYFFQSLFDISGSDISISYPKQNVFRLNGGRFDDDAWGESGTTGYYENIHHLGGSFLNGDFKLQDSDWYQNFSYLLKAGVDVVDENTGLPIYYEDLNKMLHPAGTKGFFEKTINDYIPPDDYDGTVLQGENTRLGNYFSYRLSNTTGYTACIGCSGGSNYLIGGGFDGPTAYAGTLLSGTSPYGTGASGVFGGVSGGWTYGDRWGAVGGGSISAEYNLPAHNWPDWDDDILAGLTFGGIYIRDFIYLYPATSSPNLGMTGCTASGGTGECWAAS